MLRGLLPPNEIMPDAKFTLPPSLAFSYILAALLRSTPAAGISQTLRRGTRNGITELPMFGWSAIALGIGPHSSFVVFLSSFFLGFSLPNLSGRRLDVYHTCTHGVVLVWI